MNNWTLTAHVTAPRHAWHENRRVYYARVLNRLALGDCVTLCGLDIQRTYVIGKAKTYWVSIFPHKHSQSKVIDMLIAEENKI